MNGLSTATVALMGTSGVAAAAEAATDNPLMGIAAIMAAFTGLVTAIGSFVLAWRRAPVQTSAADDAKDELLLKLLKDKLEKEEGDQP